MIAVCDETADDFIDGFSSTHALKSRTDIIIKGNRLYMKHNTFTEVWSLFVSHSC